MAAFVTCYEDMMFAFHPAIDLAGIWELWPEIQGVVDQDPEVIKAHTRVLVCLAQDGYTDVDSRLLFYWQNFQSPEDYRTRLNQFSAADRAAMRELAQPTDGCAGPAGYYRAQAAAWRAEISRLESQEPEKFKPLADSDVLVVK